MWSRLTDMNRSSSRPIKSDWTKNADDTLLSSERQFFKRMEKKDVRLVCFSLQFERVNRHVCTQCRAFSQWERSMTLHLIPLTRIRSLNCVVRWCQLIRGSNLWDLYGMRHLFRKFIMFLTRPLSSGARSECLNPYLPRTRPRIDARQPLISTSVDHYDRPPIRWKKRRNAKKQTI